MPAAPDRGAILLRTARETLEVATGDGVRIGQRREYALLLLAGLLVGVGLFRPWVHGVDSTGYYAWLRSAVIDGDLDTANEFQHFDRREAEWSDPFQSTAAGYHANPYPIGPAILWAPGFLIAHVLAPVFGYAADGYTAPYIWAITLTSVAGAWLGLLLLYSMARSWGTASAVSCAVAGVWLGSPLIFYQYAHPSMSHAADVLVNSVVVWWWSRRYSRSAGFRWWFLLGCSIGAAALVRPQNMLLGLFPGFILLAGLVSPTRSGSPDSSRARVLLLMLALGGGALLVFLPQPLLWWRVFGSPFVNVQAVSYRGPLQFDFLDPRLVAVLFSSDRGLFVWSPILLLATCGVTALWRYDRAVAGFLVANGLAQIYLIASWPTWWGFGGRMLLGLTPLWVLGLAAGFEWFRRRGLPTFPMAATAGLFAIWNALLMAQYALRLLSRDGPVDLGAMLRNQWTVVTRLCEVLAHLLC